MAEIEVVQRGPTIWPWIIGLLLLSLIVWALMEMYGASRAGSGGAAADTATVDAGSGEVQSVPSSELGGVAGDSAAMPAAPAEPGDSGRETIPPL